MPAFELVEIRHKMGQENLEYRTHAIKMDNYPFYLHLTNIKCRTCWMWTDNDEEATGELIVAVQSVLAMRLKTQMCDILYLCVCMRKSSFSFEVKRIEKWADIY